MQLSTFYYKNPPLKPTINLIDDTIELSSHGNMKTLTTHYIDAEVVTKGVSMKMFE